jgi:hypothetical protein
MLGQTVGLGDELLERARDFPDLRFGVSRQHATRLARRTGPVFICAVPHEEEVGHARPANVLTSSYDDP